MSEKLKCVMFAVLVLFSGSAYAAELIVPESEQHLWQGGAPQGVAKSGRDAAVTGDRITLRSPKQPSEAVTEPQGEVTPRSHHGDVILEWIAVGNAPVDPLTVRHAAAKFLLSHGRMDPAIPRERKSDHLEGGLGLTLVEMRDITLQNVKGDTRDIRVLRITLLRGPSVDPASATMIVEYVTK